MRHEIVIAGGGPAGLASAIAAAQQGIGALVLERRAQPVDKACGEGLLPPAVEILERLGVRQLIDPARCAPFHGLRLVNEDGSCAVGRLPRGGGLGVPRTALITALMARAVQCGVEVRDRCAVVNFRPRREGVTVETSHGSIECRLLVAADGLRSPLRRLAGLEAASNAPRRFGLRQHFEVEPWGSCVEVHFAEEMEAYVTPLGPRMLGVAFLWEEGRYDVSFSGFLSRFPAIAEKLRGARACSRAFGAGPMNRRSLAWVAPRIAIVGDAGGYVDAITGEGLSLAFGGAIALARILAQAISGSSSAAALAAYQREVSGEFRRSALAAHLMLLLARRPKLRRHVVRAFGRYPRLFSGLLRRSIGDSPEPLAAPQVWRRPAAAR